MKIRQSGSILWAVRTDNIRVQQEIGFVEILISLSHRHLLSALLQEPRQESEEEDWSIIKDAPQGVFMKIRI